MSLEKDGDWQACPAGTFDRVRGQLPAEARQRSIAPYAGAFAIGAVFAAMLFGLSLIQDTKVMACADVIPQLQDYHAQATDEATTKAIAAHLAICPNCAARYQEIAQQTANRQWRHRALALAAPTTFGAIAPLLRR